MKKLLSLSVLSILLVCNSAKAQYLFAEVSGGVCVKPINTASLIIKVGFMDLEANDEGSQGVYLKEQANMSNRVNVVQMFGLHYTRNVSGFRLNIGADYHLGSNDILNNPQTGIRLAYGVSKYFNNSPLIISADMSGKYFTASVGLCTTF